MTLIHKRRRRGCGSRRPVGANSGADAKPEQPVCEQAGAFTLGDLQELKLLSLLAKHFHVEVAVGFDPILVDFDREGSNEPQRALLVRKDADNHEFDALARD